MLALDTVMPAAKYNREPPHATSKAKVHHNYENVNLYARDSDCYGNSSNYTGHGETQAYLSAGDNPISDVTRDYVNLATPCEANAPAGTGSLHFKASTDAFCPRTTQMIDNNGAEGNFYLALAGPPNWKDSPVSKQTADEELSMQYKVYENYPLCTFANTQPTQNYCNVAESNHHAMHMGERNYSNVKYDVDARASRDCNEASLEMRKPQSSNWNLSELDYAIEHCRKIESRAVDGPSTHSVMGLENGQQPEIGREITSNGGGFYQLSTRMNRNKSVKCQQALYFNDAHMRDHQILSPSVMQKVHNDDSVEIAPLLPDKDIPTSKFTHKHKVSTALTINEQIRTLRDEMVVLRSTTMTFKHHMEKMFEDLSYINKIHRSNAVLQLEPAKISSAITNAPLMVAQPANANLRSNQVVSNVSRKKVADASNMPPSRGSHTPQKVIASTREDNQCFVNSNNGEALVKLTPAVPLSADHLEPPTVGEVMVQRLVDQEQKRTKSFERPNSDSFVQARSENTCENGDISMSLPHTPNVTCKPDLHKAAKYQKSSTDNLRVLPVLSHSNAALHISECSIDSGYQGSSETTPRERQTSQVVTPASPISELPAMPKEKQDRPLILPLELKINSHRGDCSEVFFSRCPPDDHDFLTSRHLESFVRIHRPKLNSHDTLSSLDSVDLRKEVPEISVAVRPKPRTLNSKASISSENDDERPVPKPRAKQKNESINSSAQTPLRDVDKQAVASIELHQNSIVDKCVPEALTMKISSPENHASQQCLTVLKQTSLTQVATNVSGGQKRVKLGVSAISNVNKDHQTKQVAQDARARQANKTKQALKEKFAAVLEHSRERNNISSGNLSDDSEFSVVRRRSMRMMTEFQIYDFKDSSASSSSLLNGTSQQKTNVSMHDDVYHSNSNNIANCFDQTNSNSSSSRRITVEDKSAINKHQQPYSQSMVSGLSLPMSQISPHDEQASKYSRCENELPAPPPPPPRSPPPSRSPPLVADRPPSNTNSQTSLYSEMELHPQSQMPNKPVTFPLQLIRPKPALPGVSCDFNSSQASICGGKISQSVGSAFTPVLSSSLRSLHQKQSPIADRYDMPFESIEQGYKQNDRRRVSLPLASVSNRAKAMEEINTNTIPTESHRVTEQGDKNHNLHRRSSLRHHRKHATESLGTVISAEQATITSYSVYNSEKDHHGEKRNQQNSTGEQQYLQGVHSAKFDVQCKDKSVPQPKMASSAIASHDLENQPVRYNLSDNIKHVVSALRTAGYLASESAAPNNNQQANSSNTSSIASSNATQQFVRSAKSHSSSKRSEESSRTRSSERHHHYETLKTKTDKDCSKNKVQTTVQLKTALPRHRSTSKDNAYDPPDGVAELPSKNKSTVAFLRASFMVKKDKPTKNAVVDGKRTPKAKSVPAQKSKLVSAESKTKHQESLSTKLKTNPMTKTADSKRKETTSTRKNSTIDTKQQKDKPSLKKSSKSDNKFSLSKGSKEVRHLPGLPESSNPICRGNADPEVMERFLNAAANTSASSNARSPLQKLRSSFRAPRNKTKFLQSQSKVKDDMDVSKMNSGGLTFLSSHVSKKLALKQDHYTYV